MRAVVMTARGGADVLALRDVADAVAEPGKLLVEVSIAGVNYRDIYEREARGHAGLIMGVEGVGTVVEVGDGVEGFEAGDRVGWAAGPASYAERTALPSNAAVRVPDDIDDAVACATMMQGLTAHYLCSATYPVAADDWVVVHAAAGGVGLLLTQMIKLRGGFVVATTSSEAKAAIAREAGADVLSDYESFAERVREHTDGVGAAAVYDGIGAATFDAGLLALRPHGVLVSFGQASGWPPPLDLQRLRDMPSIFLTRPALVDYVRTPQELNARAQHIFDWIRRGQLRMRIGARFALADAAQAHAALQQRQTTGKVLLAVREGAC